MITKFERYLDIYVSLKFNTHPVIEIAKLDALALGVPGDLRLLRGRLLHRLADGLLHGLSNSLIGTEAATKFALAGWTRKVPPIRWLTSQ